MILNTLALAEKEARTELSLSDFKKILETNLDSLETSSNPSIETMKSLLAKGLHPDIRETDAFIAELKEANEEKFSTPKTHLQEELKNIKNLQTQLATKEQSILSMFPS